MECLVHGHTANEGQRQDAKTDLELDSDPLYTPILPLPPSLVHFSDNLGSWKPAPTPLVNTTDVMSQHQMPSHPACLLFSDPSMLCP